MSPDYYALTIIGLQLNPFDLVVMSKIDGNKNHNDTSKRIECKYIDNFVLNENGPTINHLFDVICEKKSDIDDVDVCIGNNKTAYYTCGMLIINDNRYNVIRTNDENYVYISIYFDMCSENDDYATTYFDFNSLFNLTKMLENDLRQIDLWNKGRFGIYTIYQRS